MCLDVNFETRQQGRDFIKNVNIAKKDILVTKYLILRNNGKSGHGPFFTNFIYEKGMLHYQDGKPFTIKLKKKRIFGKGWILTISEGLHSIRKGNITFYDGQRVDMYIPKGAKYYYYNGYYVSDQLVWY